MLICQKEFCTGCGACLNICGHSAIRMQQNELGFDYPIVDDKLCVNCGLCQKTCPENNRISGFQTIECYVAAAVDEEDNKSSTSGGLATVLSRIIIREGGVVYGCYLNTCEDVRHIRIEKEEDLMLLKGSKYVQSNTYGVLKDVKKDLVKGVIVLFIGTPCQIAGLKRFLKRSYENLYTIDLICHGVPSTKLLTDAVKEYLPEHDYKKLKISFRRKNQKGSQYGLFVKDNDIYVYDGIFPDNEYVVGFLQALYYRDSCYRCIYAKKERVADITLGDYWDVENRIKIVNNDLGLSMLLVNTPKGLSLLNLSESFIQKKQDSLDNFVKRNRQLTTPMPCHGKHDEFIRLYKNEGFLKSTRICLKKDFKNIKKDQFIKAVSKIVYIIPGAERLYKRLLNR